MIDVAKRAGDFLSAVLADERVPDFVKEYIAEQLNPDLNATPRELTLKQARDDALNGSLSLAQRRAALDIIIAFAKGET